MELACPSCQRQLALAEPPASHLVQCPFCATVMDVSALLGAAPAAVPGSHAAPTDLSAVPQSGAAATLEFATATSVRTPPRRSRRRKNSGWGVLVLSIVVGVAAIPVAIYLLNRKADERAADARAAQPSAVAYRHAQEFVRKLHPESAAGQFPGKYESQKRAGGRWSIAAHYDLPSPTGPTVRKTWTAEIAHQGNEWKLLRLEVAGEEVSNPEMELPRVEFTPVGEVASAEDEDWFTGGGASAGSYQFANEQTVAWAVNLVGQEIADAAAVRKTLVVWLFDKSASAAGHRGDVLAGLSSIYQNAEQSLDGESRGPLADKPLLSVAAAFGRDLEYLVEEPTDDAGKIETAVGGIIEEGTGEEKTFAAIQAVVEKYLPLRAEQDRYLMVVVVSDEAGDDDDENTMQTTLALLTKNAVPVSVVGARAPFGRARLPGVGGPEMGTDVMNPDRGATLRQGPETPQSEHINLAFWNPSYGAEDTEFLDSGFGPYWLTRLAMESGGRYYACRGGFGGASGAAFNPAAGMLHYFDPEVMKDYAPEYVSPERYAELLAENKARRALVDAAALPRVAAMQFVRLDFPKFANEAEKAQVLGDAQKAAAVVEPKVNGLYEALKKGEADRPNLTGRRWQAAYDLAMGRALAAKVRTEGYNVMLAQLKAGTLAFSNPENDIFLLRPDDSIGAGSSYERLLKQSKMYLERVVAEHPGTPWAFLAERELQVPMGWKWVETRAGAKMDGVETP